MVRARKYISISHTETLYGKLTKLILPEPIEQLLCNDVSIITRQKVDPVVLKPQIPQKCLHNAGVLKYEVVMCSWFVVKSQA